MSTYCIADIHGCYDEFMALLDLIQFNPKFDILYVLGDAIDRGKRPIDCLRYIMRTKRVYYILGNHDVMMLDYYAGEDDIWLHNGFEETEEQLDELSESERNKIFEYLRSRPLYKTLHINENRYFLSHAGLDISLPFSKQTHDALVWSRDEFYGYKALKNYICIFGHTPTTYLRSGYDCSVWFDTRHNDKICIDCGCVYGGALAALRLDDGKTFYVKSKHGYNANRYTFNNDYAPTQFFPKLKEQQ